MASLRRAPSSKLKSSVEAPLAVRSACRVCLKNAKRSLCRARRFCAAFFDALAIRELRLSDGALREACCMKWKAASAIRMFAAVPQKSVNQYNIDEEQARRVLGNHHADVRAVAVASSQNWRIHSLKHLLRWAAMLHEVGLNINHSGLHRHSTYSATQRFCPALIRAANDDMATGTLPS